VRSKPRFEGPLESIHIAHVYRQNPHSTFVQAWPQNDCHHSRAYVMYQMADTQTVLLKLLTRSRVVARQLWQIGRLLSSVVARKIEEIN
jgi:hypothetical protein